MYPPQLIRLTKNKGTGNVWVNPEQIIFAEQTPEKEESKDEKDKKAGPKFITIIHVTGREGKLWVKESPEEINKILRSMKRTTKVEKTVTHG